MAVANFNFQCNKRVNKLLLMLLISTLAACHPSYVFEETKYYSAKLGLRYDFNINRHHTRTLARESSITVVAAPIESFRDNELGRLVAKKFNAYFAKSESVIVLKSVDSGLDHARAQRSDFLVYVVLENVRSSILSNYTSVDLLLSIVDVRTGQQFDKVRLSGDVPGWNVAGVDIEPLLGDALAALARELSGVSS